MSPRTDAIISQIRKQLTSTSSRVPKGVSTRLAFQLSPKYGDLRSPSTSSTPIAQAARQIHALKHHLVLGLALLATIVATIGFWAGTLAKPLYFSYDASNWVMYNPTLATFTWTLGGTLLSLTTTWLFNQLLRTTCRQVISSGTVDVRTIEFWSRLSAGRVLHDLSVRNLKLSAATIVFVMAAATLTPGYTALITPTLLVFNQTTTTHYLDITSSGFQGWYSHRGRKLLSDCSVWHHYTRAAGPNSILGSPSGNFSTSLAACPQTESDISVLLASASAFIDTGAMVTNFFYTTFSGTTYGTVPTGPVGLQWFRDYYTPTQPTFQPENYTFSHQGVMVNVLCTVVKNNSRIQVSSHGALRGQTIENGLYEESVSFSPLGSTDNATWSYSMVTDGNFVAAFDYRGQDGLQVIEVASFGELNHMPNMSCRLNPIIQNIMVGYSDGLFLPARDYDPHRDSFDPIRGHVAASEERATNLLPSATLSAPVALLRGATTAHGNQIINAMSYQNRIYDYVSVLGYEHVWTGNMAHFIASAVEYHASYMRLLFMLDMWVNQENTTANGFRAAPGYGESWTLGYKGGRTTPYTLFLSLGFILICATLLIIVGISTGATHVSYFDPLDTTDLIVASAVGGSRGLLSTIETNAIVKERWTGQTFIQYNKRGGLRIVPDDKAGFYN